MAFMERNGFRLYHADTGGNGPAVLFLHGAGGNHLSWWQQAFRGKSLARIASQGHRRQPARV